MKRSEFFKKSILGAFAIWKAPEILAPKENIVESTNGVLNYISINKFNYTEYKLTEAEYAKSIERVFLIGRQWTPEQEKQLLKTRR